MPLPVIEALVVDVLGTLVDERGGLRAGIRIAAPGVDETELEGLVDAWQRHVGQQQQRIVCGERTFTPSQVLDREAAELVTARAGAGSPTAISELAAAGQRLAPWPDSVPGLARLAERFPLIGLSNASRAALFRLNAHAGLRWHQALSAESAETYKPAGEVYRLAVEVAARPPERLLMVAAHAWDLRAARRIGMRTAYVRRPVGDPPEPGERFDLHADGLADLADQLDERAEA